MSIPNTVEVIATPKQPFGLSSPQPAPQRRRLILFLALFLLSLASSLAYVWMREPVYETRASLLTVSPEQVGQAKVPGGIAPVRPVKQDHGLSPSELLAGLESPRKPGGTEHVTIQRQLLLGVPLLEETLRRFYEEKDPAQSPRLGLADLRRLFDVDMVTETNLVELKARGPQSKILAPLVNAWIDAYQRLREDSLRDSAINNRAALEEESMRLEGKVAEKRAQLEQFRASHEILSRTDADNTPMLQLKGLNEALSKAMDEMLKAKAKLASIKNAIAKGEPVLPPEDSVSVANLERRLQEMLEMEKDGERRYTKAYLALNPQLKEVPSQIEQIRNKIKELNQAGTNATLSQASQDYASAEQSATELRQKIVEMKREVTEFTNRFAEQESIQADLNWLEQMHMENKAKLASLETKPQEIYPPLQVVERAYPPTSPVWPTYWRDSVLALASSLVFGLLFVGLYDYLTRQEAAVGLPNFQFFSVGGSSSAAITATEQQQELLPRAEAATPALESPDPRELTNHEIHVLLDAATPETKAWIGLLLSGLTLEEIADLSTENLDIQAKQVRPSKDNPRSVPLAEVVQTAFASLSAAGAFWPPGLDVEDMAARISCAAFDSGLAQPETINAEALRHTCLVHLVRQGLRLAELERVVGRVPAKVLAAYGRYSPAGPGLPVERVSLLHPALA